MVLAHNAGICTEIFNWKSQKQFGHTFSDHGAGAKRTEALKDRARRHSNKPPQG